MSETNRDIGAFLEGYNPLKGVVKLECAYNDDHVTLVIRGDDGKKKYERKPFYPFVWVMKEALDIMYNTNKKTFQGLSKYGLKVVPLKTTMNGTTPHPRLANGYTSMITATKPMSYSKFMSFFKKKPISMPIYPNEGEQGYNKRYFISLNPVEQFMISTGIRQFKGFDDYDGLLRIEWDLETEGLDPQKCMISQIGIRTNKGFEKIITIDGKTPDEKFDNELNGIKEFFSIISDIDGDVMTGHNTENFDWVFVDERLKKHGSSLEDMSREYFPNGIYKKNKQTVLKLGGEMEYYYPTVYWGTNITDSLHAVRRAQALNSNIKYSNLKYITQFSKLNKKNRVYIPGKIINKTWNDNDKNNYAFNNTNGKWFKITDKILKKKLFVPSEKKYLYGNIEEPVTKKITISENHDFYNLKLGEIFENEGYRCFVKGVEEGEMWIITDMPDHIITYEYSERKPVYVPYNDGEEIPEGFDIVTCRELIEKLGCDETTNPEFYENTGKKRYEYETITDSEGNTTEILRDYFDNTEYALVTGRYIAERYLLDDLYESDKVELKFNQTNFFLSKLLPVAFDRVVTMGTAAVWKYIMLTWSFENNLAVPLPDKMRPFTGGISRVLKLGLCTNILKLDFNSLYPSIILSYGIKSRIDIADTMPSLLEYILTTREKYKEEKKRYKKLYDNNAEGREEFIAKHTQEEITQYDADTKYYYSQYAVFDNMQSAIKVVGNGFFGSYGSGPVFPWSDMDCAEETTCTGRQCLRLMINHFMALGYIPLVGDTDGFNFQLPDNHRFTKGHPYIGKGLNRLVKKGKEYYNEEADLMEFNDMYMRVKMGLDIDEYIKASVQVSRKNYIDDLGEDGIKIVGNTLKSKKMPIYIEKFLQTAFRLLLDGKGKEFIDFYYDYVEKIYNYQIPLKDIASVGKIKTSIEDYKARCNEKTKSGQKKSRQAWYELAIKENLNVNMGDAIYYINTGDKDNSSDVQKTETYYVINNGNKVDMTKAYRKERNRIMEIYKKNPYSEECKDYVGENGKIVTLGDYVSIAHPDAFEEDSLFFNCVYIPNEVIDDDDNTYSDDTIEYNVKKYIKMLNSKVKSLLVVFHPDIRTTVTSDGKVKDNILITNPKDRKYFTTDECVMVAGYPNKKTDQDYIEEVLTMEDKEIRFWLSVNKKPPYTKECGMDWEKMKIGYYERMAKESEDGTAAEKKLFEELVMHVTDSELDTFTDDYTLPSSLSKHFKFDIDTNNFISKSNGNIIATIHDLLDRVYIDDDENGDDVSETPQKSQKTDDFDKNDVIEKPVEHNAKKEENVSFINSDGVVTCNLSVSDNGVVEFL